jgi:hypothetical protein
MIEPRQDLSGRVDTIKMPRWKSSGKKFDLIFSAAVGQDGASIRQNGALRNPDPPYY